MRSVLGASITIRRRRRRGTSLFPQICSLGLYGDKSGIAYDPIINARGLPTLILERRKALWRQTGANRLGTQPPH